MTLDLETLKKVHFIAISGSVMHSLAITLAERGIDVTGSDDVSQDPSRSRLEKAGLLPDPLGWSPEKITEDLDAVIIGMHAKIDNPELIKAQALGIPIYSFPELMHLLTRDKTRVVICGSHGKTTTTAMLLHVLQSVGKELDYLLGAKVEGFEHNVSISSDTNLAVFEGDEYLSSPLDRRPKFLNYKPNIAVITGIAWDHINVFPTEENYRDQFRALLDIISSQGTVIYCQDDPDLVTLCEEYRTKRANLTWISYSAHAYKIDQGQAILTDDNDQSVSAPLKIFGAHNMANLQAAHLVFQQLGFSDEQFYQAIPNFSGAARRLSVLAENGSKKTYLDFAHAPSKVTATVKAVRETAPDQKILACVELHTYSSLNKDFLHHYQNSMAGADHAIVYFNPANFEWKNLPPFNKQDILDAFQQDGLIVIDDATELEEALLTYGQKSNITLLMSSGNFHGLDLQNLAHKICDGNDRAP